MWSSPIGETAGEYLSEEGGTMERWGELDSPLMKAVTGSAVLLFLALNFPWIFLAIVCAVLSYATALLAVVQTYRNRYGIVGKPELAVRFTAKALAGLKAGCERTVARTLEKRESRQRVRLEREEKLRRYKRERNRRKRERVRRVPAQR
jgi:hypothetical protein